MPKLLFAARLLCAAPLLLIGIQHLTGAAPLQPILDGAAIPLPKLVALLAPLAEVLAGVLLVLGLVPRVAGLLAAGTMVGAILTHLRYDWADEPPLALPIAVLALALLVAARGAGAWALRASSKGEARPTA
jgi:putative oxidoreductase